ncbi:MAG: transcriptional regulator [Deltaproteobacteria bacterium]
MTRFLLYFLICFLIYLLFKRVFTRQATQRPYAEQRRPSPIQDELVRDPVCGVYCPKRDALMLRTWGETHYFCSEECRRRFLQENSPEKGS